MNALLFVIGSLCFTDGDLYLMQIEAASGDEFIEIHVSDPQKIGDGMSSYMAYKVTTKTNITYFRWEDFLSENDLRISKMVFE